MSRVAEIEQTAAEWLARREDTGWTHSDQAALDNWLAASFAHKAAYWRLDHGWRQADRIGSLGPQAAGEDSAVRTKPSIRALAIAASVAILCGIGLAIWSDAGSSSPRTQVAETQVGQRGELRLSDGSKVELNTASRARTVIAATRREVWLDRGEAYFDVAHDRMRPFVVHAGPTTITVLGTRFGVRRNGTRITVAVIEGRVRLASASNDGANRSTLITAGDTALTGDGALMLAPRSAERVDGELAWRYGVLRFNGETLGAVVAEFNRYNHRKIVVSDAEVGAIRIGGAFHASNSDAFLRLLREAYGLRIDQQGDTVRISD